MRKKVVAANWKMNLLRSEASGLAGEIIKGLPGPKIYNKVDLIIAPTFTSLNAVQSIIKETGVQLCAQNVFWKESGAYTGEISAGMLIDCGCKWVIIGHSERRHILKETDEMVSLKVKSGLNGGLKVILCVGELKDERENGKTMEVISNQLVKGLGGLDSACIDSLVIAYEPVWAIGTGLNAEPEDAEAVHRNIKEVVSGLLDCKIEKIRVMYGGSVNTGNIKSLVSQPNVDGVLVGGASLNKDSFLEIIRVSGD